MLLGQIFVWTKKNKLLYNFSQPVRTSKSVVNHGPTYYSKENH